MYRGAENIKMHTCLQNEHVPVKIKLLLAYLGISEWDTEDHMLRAHDVMNLK